MRISLNGDGWRILGLPPNEWVWRQIGSPATDLDRIRPAVGAWTPAVVPGDVQSDLVDAGVLPDPFFELNSRACEWTSHRDWVYHRDFTAPADAAGRTMHLRFAGVDDACHVFLNGERLGEHVGPYTPFEFEVTHIVRPGSTNRLVVVVEQAPTEPEIQGQIGWTSRIRRWKPRFAYGWDWCTRLVPLGIIDDVELVVSDGARLADVWVRPDLEGEPRADGTWAAGTVRVTATVQTFAPFDGAVHFVLRDPSGRTVAAADTDAACAEPGIAPVHAELTVSAPEQWWPNGSGPQPLYTLHAALRRRDGATVDERAERCAFRRVRFVANDGAPADALPYVLEVNGVRTFMKGWNWAPISQLYGRTLADRYDHALRMAAHAHCNFLRVWGGGLLERRRFYDRCDELGILVWQEFFQSSSGIDNQPASDPAFVQYAASIAREVVPLRRNHPSLAVWCGGNELTYDGMRPLDCEHPVIAALRDVVAELDPGRAFLPTSPSGPEFAALHETIGRQHDVHGHWLWLGDPEHYRFYNAIDPLLHSEFGVEGPGNLVSLRRFISEERLWPPDETNPVWVHHGAWWICREKVEALFGPIGDIETYVRAGQWMQYEGLRYACEASRRRKQHTAGCMPWQLNEAWPNASCTNALDYYGRPRPAFWGVANAYAPVLVSARYDRMAGKPGEPLAAEVWVCRSFGGDAVARVEWTLHDVVEGAQLAQGALDASECGVGRPCKLGLAEAALPVAPTVVALHLRALKPDGAPTAENTYCFSSLAVNPLSPLLALRRARLVAACGAGLLQIRGDGAGLFGVEIAAREDRGGPLPSRGYVPFVPGGAPCEIRVEGSGSMIVSAWNADPIEVHLP